MSTEVGSLQANLTLDMSNFKAGMAEAANLATQLSAQLQSALNGNTGFDKMSREIAELAVQMTNLRSATESFQAAMRTFTGTDMFAQIRTHTSALPSEIASIASALNSANTAATQLANSLATVQSNLSATATSLAGLNLGALSTGAPTFDFSLALSQLTQMQSQMGSLISLIQQANNIDLGTGEVFGDMDQVPAIATMFSNFQEVGNSIQGIHATLQECITATSLWANEMSKVQGHTQRIAQQLQAALNAMRGVASSGRGVGSGAQNFANQTGRASKNLQTAKGYAVSVKGILGGIVISQAFYSLLNIMEELVQGSIKFSQNMQDTGVAFKYLMEGASVSSEAFLNALKDIALQSPLDTTDLTSSARKLMAMGFSAEATVPALRILTDTAAVFSNSAGDMSDMIDHISLAFGQMIASGKVSAQELRQLYNAGLPIYDLLADGLGISKQMAKNIGHYNVDSASAVFAVLDQLQKRYGGAAAEMATTMSGSLEVIRESIQQILSYGWSDIFDTITQKLNVVAKFAQALVKITQAYGPGGLFQAIFPPSTWSTLRQLLGGFQMLGSAAIQLGAILKQAFGGGLQLIVGIGAQVIPIVATLANGFLYMARTALAASPMLRALLAGMIALTIGSVVAKIMTFLAKAIYLLSGAKAAVGALRSLGRALVAFTGWSKGAVIAAMAIAAALLAIVASSEKARAALASFFGGAVSKFNNFAQSLNVGFDPGKIAMPEFQMPDTSDFAGGLQDMSDAMDQLADSADKAGKAVKKAKKNIQSFDEVYNIDTSEDNGGSGAGGAIDSMMDSLKNLGSLDYSNLFDWTGDWATDWGNLTAGLGDLTSSMGDAFGNMSGLANKLWSSLSDALMANPQVTGSLIGTAIGAVLGALVGHPKIGAALGAVAGFIVGDFWSMVAEKFNLPVEAGTQATIASGIGSMLGVAIGYALGGKLGATLGGIIGTGVAGIGTLIWEKLQQDFHISSEAGERTFGTTVANSVGTALMQSIKTMINSVFGKGAVQGLDDIWAGITLAFSKEGIKALGNASTWATVGKSLKNGLKGGIISALAGFALDFLTQWIVGAVGQSVGASAEQIARGEEWASWGSTILGTIGSIVGTIIAPGIGTLVGGLIGQLVGSLGGGALGLWWEDICNWWNGVWGSITGFFTDTIPNFFKGVGSVITSAFSSAWNGVKTFFTETIPGWWNTFLNGLSTFFTQTIPQKLGEAGYVIGYALGTIARAFVDFFTVTIPKAWNDFTTALTTFFTVTIPEKFNQLVEILKTFFTQTIPNAWNEFKTWLVTTKDAIINGIVTFFTVTIPEKFNQLVTTLKTFFTVTLPNAFTTLFTELGKFKNKILGKIKTFFTVTIPQKFEELITSIKNLGKRVIDGLLEGLKGAWGSVTNWIKSFKDNFVQGFKDAFGIHSPADEMVDPGAYLILGIEEGVDDEMAQMESWLDSNVYKVIGNWFQKNFCIDNFVEFGVNIMQGIQVGITNMLPAIESRVSSICASIRRRIQSALSIHSPSSFTEWCGEMLMSGMVNGIVDNAKMAIKAATDAAHKLTEAIQPEESAPNDLLDASTLSSVKALNALSTWAHTFTSILTTTFNSIADMFDDLTARITAATFAIQNTPTAINSRMGSLAAVEGVVETARNAHTTGTSQIMRVLADLTEDTLSKLSDRIAIRIYEYLAPLFADMSVDDQDRIIAYIGTLIADDQGLKMLERKLYDIRQVNQTRR